MLEKLYINEDINKNSTIWSLSFGKPKFQGGETIIIDYKTVQEILEIKYRMKNITPIKNQIGNFDYLQENFIS